MCFVNGWCLSPPPAARWGKGKRARPCLVTIWYFSILLVSNIVENVFGKLLTSLSTSSSMMRKRQKGSTLFGDCYNLGLSCPCQITQRFTLQCTSAQSEMQNAIAQIDSLSLIAMCIALNIRLYSLYWAYNVFQHIVQIVSSVHASS